MIINSEFVQICRNTTVTYFKIHIAWGYEVKYEKLQQSFEPSNSRIGIRVWSPDTPHICPVWTGNCHVMLSAFSTVFPLRKVSTSASSQSEYHDPNLSSFIPVADCDNSISLPARGRVPPSLRANGLAAVARRHSLPTLWEPRWTRTLSQCTRRGSLVFKCFAQQGLTSQHSHTLT
jgi:hypothetical protein